MSGGIEWIFLELIFAYDDSTDEMEGRTKGGVGKGSGNSGRE